MHKEDHIWDLLAAYFSGNISEADKTLVKNWAENSANAQIFLEAKRIWESSTVDLRYPSDSIKQLASFRVRVKKNQNPVWRLRSALTGRRSLAIAACLCILIATLYVFRPGAKQIVLESGSAVTTVMLPDSSKVWLNVNSRITYSEKFSPRKIDLEGEAFFSVRKSASGAPFTVYTRHSVTQVLGTVFNLNEQGDSAVTLHVINGSVMFSGLKTSQEQAVKIGASENATLDSESGIRTSKTTSTEIGRWREVNNLSFEAEKNSPQEYLINKYAWRKNAVNQSVIEGTITNTAALAGYYRIVLLAVYVRPDGKKVEVQHVIREAVYPGKRITYRKRIFDILSDTKAVTVTVKSASVTTNKSF